MEPSLPKLALPPTPPSSGMLPLWVGSISVSPATISGTLATNLLTTRCGPCVGECSCWQHELAYPGVQKSHFYAVTPILCKFCSDAQ